MPPRTWTVLAIAAFGAWLYASSLDSAPMYIMHDESQFALQAQSIAAQGRDLGGRALPVFFSEPEFPAGRDPVIIYVTAALLKVLPFAEGTARLATALVGVLNLVLMFAVVRALFGSTPLGVVGAGLLALTPIHFIRARLVLSPFYSIPFILLWLWTMAEYERQPASRRLWLAGAWLGLGIYTYLACVVMMPVYLAATVMVAWRRSGAAGAGAAVAGCLAVLVPMLAWYALHPDRVQQIFGSYREYSEAPAALTIDGVRTRAALYWSFFDPSFLFVSGDSSLVNSTRRAGFFPAAFAVLIPIGLYWCAKSRRPVFWITGMGFLLSPLAAVVSGAIEMNRLMFAIPFGVLVACIGSVTLLGGRLTERVAAVLLLASIPLQFARFHEDYFGRYRAEAGSWFGGNIRDAMVPVIVAEPAGAAQRIYISDRIPFARRYWRFYALESRRPELIDTPTYYWDFPAAAQAGSYAICASASPECQALVAQGWHRRQQATEPDGTPAFDVLIRQPAS